MISKNLTFSFNHKDQRDKLYEVMTSQDIKNNFDSRAEELKTYIYNMVDDLSSTTGSQNIGYRGITVYSKLDSIDTEITAARQGKASLLANLNEIRELLGGTGDGHTHSNKTILDNVTNTNITNWNTAYTHSQSTHAPTTAQKNSDITKAEIEAKLIGDIPTHTHSSYSPTSHTHLKANITDFPTKLSEFTNDIGASGGTGGTGDGHTHDNMSTLNNLTPFKLEELDSKPSRFEFESLSNDVSNNTSSLADITQQLNETNPTFPYMLTMANSPLDIATYDGGNEAMHPKVVYFKNGWNGYKYWMAETPYKGMVENIENPCIHVSNDGITWSVPNGLTNPIDQTTDVSTHHLSDPHLIYNPNTNKLECFYREAYRPSNMKETLLRKTSSNGIIWSASEICKVWEGSNTNALCPVIIFEDNKYKLWVAGTAPTTRKFKYYESADGLTWGAEIIIEPTGISGTISHFDVIKYNNKYILITNTTNLDKYYYLDSTDNITYSNTQVVLNKSGWTSQKLYRPSMCEVEGYIYLYYCGVDSNSAWRTGLIKIPPSTILNKLEKLMEENLYLNSKIVEFETRIKALENGTVAPEIIYGQILISKTTTTIVEGGTDTFTVTLDKAPTNNQTVILSKNNSDISLSSTSLTFTPTNWNTAQTITINVAEDDTDYSNETCTITLTSPNVTSKTLVVTITDNDTPTGDVYGDIVLSKTTTTITEGGTDTFTVKLSQSPTNDQTITLTKDNADVTLDKTSLTFTTSNWNTTQTVTITVAEDGDSTDESCTINATSPNVTTKTLTVNITDNDVVSDLSQYLICDYSTLKTNTDGTKNIWTDNKGTYDGTLTNFGYTASSGWTTGGLKLDGNDDYISNTLNTFLSNSSNEFTIKTTLTMNTSNLNRRCIWSFGGNYLALWISDDAYGLTNANKLYLKAVDNVTAQDVNLISPNVITSSETDIIVTKKGTNISMYINKVIVSSITVELNYSKILYSVLGGYKNTTNSPIKFDDSLYKSFKVYSKALTQAEINTL